jgi:filamentous hemagglutinin
MTNGSLTASGDITLTGTTIQNTGVIQVTGTDHHLSITADAMSQENGVLQSAGSIGLTAKTMEVSGWINASENMDIESASRLVNRGQIQSDKALSFYGEGVLTNDSGTIMADSLLLRTNGLINTNISVIKGNSAIDINAPITNSGILQSGGALGVTGSVSNSGTMVGVGPLTINGNTLDNSGWMESGKAIAITSQVFTNSGTIRTAHDDIRLVGDTIGNSGDIYTGGRLNLEAATSITNNSSTCGMG